MQIDPSDMKSRISAANKFSVKARGIIDKYDKRP